MQNNAAILLYNASMRYLLPNRCFQILVLLLIASQLAGCASRPPQDQDNLCRIFAQNPRWYDYALASERRWGTPIAVQMAFVQQESSFRA